MGMFDDYIKRLDNVRSAATEAAATLADIQAVYQPKIEAVHAQFDNLIAETTDQAQTVRASLPGYDQKVHEAVEAGKIREAGYLKSDRLEAELQAVKLEEAAAGLRVQKLMELNQYEAAYELEAAPIFERLAPALGGLENLTRGLPSQLQYNSNNRSVNLSVARKGLDVAQGNRQAMVNYAVKETPVIAREN